MKTIDFNKYTELKEEKLSRLEIANYFEIPEWKLKRIISENGWGKKAPLIGNLSAFNSYNEESCYWAGFLAADGNVDRKGRIRLMLNYDDILHLEKFKTYLKSTHKVSSNTSTYNRCSFEFTNKQMCNALTDNFNIVPEKSLVLQFPSLISGDMIKHFIRGYFDGDGSVCESFSNKNSITATLYATFVGGSYDFIQHIFTYFSNTLGTVGHLQDFGTGKKWQIKYNTNDAKLVLSYMYENSKIYLDRKYSLYNRIVVKDIRLTR